MARLPNRNHGYTLDHIIHTLYNTSWAPIGMGKAGSLAPSRGWKTERQSPFNGLLPELIFRRSWRIHGSFGSSLRCTNFSKLSASTGLAPWALTRVSGSLPLDAGGFTPDPRYRLTLRACPWHQSICPSSDVIIPWFTVETVRIALRYSEWPHKMTVHMHLQQGWKN